MKEKYDFSEISTLGRFFLESPEAGLLLSRCFCVTLSGKKRKTLFSDHLLEMLLTLVTTKAAQIPLC